MQHTFLSHNVAALGELQAHRSPTAEIGCVSFYYSSVVEIGWNFLILFSRHVEIGYVFFYSLDAQEYCRK